MTKTFDIPARKDRSTKITENHCAAEKSTLCFPFSHALLDSPAAAAAATAAAYISRSRFCRFVWREISSAYSCSSRVAYQC